MAQIIDVPGYGPTEFPDGMSDAEIVSAIQKNMVAAPKPTTSTSPVADKKEFKVSDLFAVPVAALEMGANMATGVGGQMWGGLAGLKDLATGSSVDDAAKTVRDVQKMLTYEPKTDLGQGGMKVVSYPFEKGMEMTKAVGGAIGEKVGGEQGRIAGEAIGEQVIPVVGTLAGGYGALKNARASAAAQQQALINQSYQDAARIDAAKLAVEKYGLSLDPVTSNPTTANLVRTTAVGQDHLNSLIRRHNEPLVANILKEDVGIPKATPLTSSAVFDEVRNAAGAAKRDIQQIPSLVPDVTDLAKLQAITPEALIGGKTAQKRVVKLVDEATQLLSHPVSGARVISEIENLRKNARDIYKGKEVKPTQRAVADAYMSIANTLEGMIENNLQQMGRTDILQSFKDGRTKMAKAYTLEAATDLNTGLVDPMVIAKMTAKDNALSGAFADIGKIAGNFPQALGIKPGASGGLKEFATTHLTRSGPTFAAGWAAGGLVGQPILGGMLGAGAGELFGSLYGRKLATNQALQQTVSVPKDYRPKGMMTP